MILSTFENLKISGIACAVPKKKDILLDKYGSVFGEEDVLKFSKMTGVVSRNISAKEQTASDLAFVAAKNLMKHKQIEASSIEVLIFVTQTPDYIMPSTACILHHRLGLSKDCLAFDINLGCSGYIYGLQTISSLMHSSNIKRGLLLVGDTLNKVIAPEDKSSCMLFGDAGSATLLEKRQDAPIIQTALRMDGDGFKAIIVPAGAYRNMDAPKERTLWGDGNIRSDFDLYMNGTDVFNFTISEVPMLIKEFMAEINTNVDDYDGLILHQANEYILKQIMKRTKFPKEKTPISMDRYGNTSVTSIPLTITDAYGSINNGALKLLMCGFGIGLSWGVVSCVLETDDVLPIIETEEIYMDGGVSHD
ncbi:3-oxoacyl-ACP synthase III family protein [Dehalobacterium formicoaceticum]|uniref:3-oxoacyl-ACP synthase III family protein n=1 Tax=Dehalobacterium formicoaceticum TaxID=51515 RepID=UPI000B7F4E5D|nr:ketoacyl-ACP synthase III [Dehalobacterium formicoaceticum]